MLRMELAAEIFCQEIGALSDVAACNVKPAGDAGHETTTFVPLNPADNFTGEKSKASA